VLPTVKPRKNGRRAAANRSRARRRRAVARTPSASAPNLRAAPARLPPRNPAISSHRVTLTVRNPAGLRLQARKRARASAGVMLAATPPWHPVKADNAAPHRAQRAWPRLRRARARPHGSFRAATYDQRRA
jgi:hypothetical protein